MNTNFNFDYKNDVYGDLLKQLQNSLGLVLSYGANSSEYYPSGAYTVKGIFYNEQNKIMYQPLKKDLLGKPNNFYVLFEDQTNKKYTITVPLVNVIRMLQSDKTITLDSDESVVEKLLAVNYVGTLGVKENKPSKLQNGKSLEQLKATYYHNGEVMSNNYSIIPIHFISRKPNEFNFKKEKECDKITNKELTKTNVNSNDLYNKRIIELERKKIDLQKPIYCKEEPKTIKKTR